MCYCASCLSNDCLISCLCWFQIGNHWFDIVACVIKKWIISNVRPWNNSYKIYMLNIVLTILIHMCNLYLQNNPHIWQTDEGFYGDSNTVGRLYAALRIPIEWHLSTARAINKERFYCALAVLKCHWPIGLRSLAWSRTHYIKDMTDSSIKPAKDLRLIYFAAK